MREHQWKEWLVRENIGGKRYLVCGGWEGRRVQRERIGERKPSQRESAVESRRDYC